MDIISLKVFMHIAEILQYLYGQEYRAYQAKAIIAMTLSNRTYLLKLIEVLIREREREREKESEQSAV